MKNILKILAFLVVSMLVVSFISGCGKTYVRKTADPAAASPGEPQITILAPKDNATISGAIAIICSVYAGDNAAMQSISFAVNGTTVKSIQNLPADQEIYEYILDTTALPDGSTSLAVTATNSASLSKVALVTINVQNNPNNPDTSLPVVEILAPKSGASFCNQDINISARVTSTKAISSVTLYINGLNLGAMSNAADGSYSASISSATLANGSHIIEIAAESANGKGTASAWFTVANSSPPLPLSLEIAEPEKDATVSTSLHIRALVSNGDALTRVEAFVRGTSVGTLTMGENGYTADFNISGLENGPAVLKVCATDPNDLSRRAEKEINILISNPADQPNLRVEIIAPVNSAQVQGTVTVLARTSPVTRTDKQSVRLSVAGQDLGEMTLQGTGETYRWYSKTFDANAFAIGNTSILVRASYKTPPLETTEDSVVVDIQHPVVPPTPEATVEITSPDDNASVSGKQVQVCAIIRQANPDSVDLYVGTEFIKAMTPMAGGENYSASFDSLDFANGNATIFVRASWANIVITDSVVVNIQNSTPRGVVFWAPSQEGMTISGSSAAVCIATQGFNARNAFLYINCPGDPPPHGTTMWEIAAPAYNNGNVWVYNLNTNSIPNGSATLTVAAYPQDGSDRILQTRTVKIDNPVHQ